MSTHTPVSFRKALSAALLVLQIMMTATIGSSQSRTQGDVPAPEKIRAKVAGLGTGKRARAEVILKDDGKLKGYIGEISEHGFTLVDPKRGTVTTIPYDEVRQVKNRNHDGTHLAVAGAAMVGAIVLALVLATGSR
jgi:hypothetical protein